MTKHAEDFFAAASASAMARRSSPSSRAAIEPPADSWKERGGGGGELLLLRGAVGLRTGLLAHLFVQGLLHVVNQRWRLLDGAVRQRIVIRQRAQAAVLGALCCQQCMQILYIIGMSDR